MKKITLISIILALISMGHVVPQEIIFEDDFESYSVGTFPSTPWYLRYNGNGTANQIVVDDHYVSSNQSLKLECAPNWAGTADLLLSQTPPVIYCEGYIMTELGSSFGFWNPDIGPWGTSYANVGIADGNIYCNDQILQTGSSNQWYHLKLKYNSYLDVCNVWVDGVLVGQNITCYTNGEYSVFRMGTYNPSTSTKGWFDDIKVYYSSGWNREGYDLGWSFFNPNATQTSIQNFLLGVDWSTNIENPNVLEGDNIDILTGDVNGDGFPELVYTSNNIIHVLDGNGNELWSTDSGLVDECHHNALEDVTGDGIPEIIIGAKISSTLKLLFYDGYGNLIKEITETEQVSQYDYIKARAVQDIDNDGDLEVIFWRLWGFEPWSRGIGVFDYNSGHREWFFPIGPNIWTLCVADVTGDSNMEILTGTIGPCNGHSANGFSDCSCYAICWDKDGNLIWSQQFEGSGFVDTKVSINDLDGDGKNEVIYTSFEHGWETWDGDLGRIYLLNPDNGEIMKEYNAGMPIRVNGVADITGNDNKEILVTCSNGATQTGKIIMFDNSLNLLNEYSIQGTTLGICAINDLNGDDELEIIVRKLLYDEFAVLDDSLNELWSVQYDDDILNVIPTDLNNDGINELIVSTENTLQVLEFKFMPSFAIDLNDQVACKNDSIAFEVIVEGSLPIDYQWQKDNINIPGAMESTLILPDVQAEDGGEYRCIATNDYGSDTSNAALLTIEFAIPTNITGPTNVIEYQVVLYSVAMQEGHTYEFMVEGGNQIDVTENTITVHWGTAGQGFVELLETSELGCYADTITLNVTIGNLISIDDYETHNLSVYPNPFTSSTTIEYTLKQPSYVQIIIYNHLGEQIDIICKNQSQGLQKVVWNAKGLPAGIYYFRIQVGDQVVAKKIIKQ